MLHEISVSSSSFSTTEISTQLNDITPTPPTENNTYASHLAYTPYHPENLDATLHTPYPIIPNMADRVPDDTIPIIRPVDRPSSTEPQMKSYSTELFQKCVGFHNIRKIIASKHLAQPTIAFPNLGRDPVRDLGEVATLPKKRRNKHPSDPPALFGDVFHYDIVYGANTAIGGYRHALFLVDVKTRHLFEYPLRDITGASLQHAVSTFTKDIGGKPRRMLADRDFRLIGGEVATFLEASDPDDPNSIQSHAAGAPAGRQNQNGLSEIRWKNILNMVRNWMTSNLLPFEFWYFGLRYAVQVTNMMPVTLVDGTLSTPFELAYGVKPDWRNLLPLFSIAYVKRFRDGDTHRKSPYCQTIKGICVGNDSKSDGKLFYIPHTRSLIGSSDFTLDPAPPSGPCFDLPYDGGINFNLLAPDDTTLRPPTFDINTPVYVQSPTTHEFHDATIIDIPLGGSHMFTVHYKDTDDIEQVHRDCIHDLCPNTPAAPSWQPSPFPSAPWITHTSTKVTMFLPSKMSSPKQGYLLQDSSGQWAFVPGRKTSSRNKGISLPNFPSTFNDYIADQHLFPGWINKKTVLDKIALHTASIITARRIQFCGSSEFQSISDSATLAAVNTFFSNPSFARHVSASNLHHLAPP